MRRSMPRASWMLLACWVLVGGMPLTARAQEDFNRFFNAAVQLYKDGESELALKQLERAKQRTGNLDQDIAVALYEGLSYADLSQWKQARDAFERALLLDPEAKLPIKVSPKVERDFEEVRARVRTTLAQNPGTAKTDRPERQPVKPDLSPALPTAPPAVVSTEAVREHKRIPITPVILAGVGVAAAGVGTVFGLQSRSAVSDARRAQFQDETRTQLEEARSSARIANVLFGAAGLAATGALVSWWVSRGEGEADQSTGER